MLLLKVVVSAAAVGTFLAGVAWLVRAVRPLRPGEAANALDSGIPARGWPGVVWAALWMVSGAGVALSLWLR